MLKFLPGLILLQIITVCLVLTAPDTLTGWAWIRLLVPLLITAILMAFWFASIASHRNKDEIMRLRESHAREREKIKVNAERAKQRVSKDAQKQVQREIRMTTAKANLKVGAALTGAACIGGFLLLTQFLTLGIVVLTTAGGTLGGYLLRVKQEHNKLLANEVPNTAIPAPASAKQTRIINPPPESS